MGQIASERMAAYRATARRREAEAKRDTEARRVRAWALARRSAELLRERFGATRVVLFGSLLRETGFTRWSDLDIAAWGIRPEDTFRAVGAVMDLDPAIPVNLVDVAACPPGLLEHAEREGRDL